MKERYKGIVIGFIIGISVAMTTVIASTGAIQKQLHYNNIKITLEGKEIIPTDVNGNYVEPFIIDGTTYLPVRGIASALGLGVDWDGETNTVVLTNTPTNEKTAVEKFVNSYGFMIKTAFEEGAKKTGYTFDTDISAQGNTITVNAKINEVNNLTTEEKADMQAAIDSNIGEIEANLKKVSVFVPSLEKVVLNILESDADLIVKVEIDI